MVMLQRTRVYKILSQEDWAVAQDFGYSQTALDEGDGYVHLSTRDQVHDTLFLHYPGYENVRLLEFIIEEMDATIRWEESRGGQLFPHLYGRLRMDAAARAWTLSLDADGVPALPADIDA